ncbi:DUF4037 domain-containing protein [Atopobium fossor]|uniref:DUF4037 domain-containing protein n=1 Tax=Atopobium fossor TaxID=39487 RepID=UPI0003F9233A|nr:DUF4037 domain-containing protein [Atopobium fossor]
MKGLDISRQYFAANKSTLLAGLPCEITNRIAIGLVGAGSECLGFDDELSRDHDFGPGFCIWLPRSMYATWKDEFTRRYEALPSSFNGMTRQESELAGQRVGVFETQAFYRLFTGLDRAPQTDSEWLAIPEQLLAMSVSGEVFFDPSGFFSSIRQELLGFYPEVVIRKKIAANMAQMAQAGQYNLLRCSKRVDFVAADAARTEFMWSTMAVLHLLSRCYMPYYKWSFRSLVEHACVPDSLCVSLQHIAQSPIDKLDIHEVEYLCAVVLGSVKKLGWTSVTGDFLLDAARDIWQSLNSSELRMRPLAEGVYRP